jgi:hypothetical protein
MFVSRWGFSNYGLVASSHPSSKSVRIIYECLGVGFIIVEVSQYDGRGLDHELSWLIISSEFFTFGRYNLRIEAR